MYLQLKKRRAKWSHSSKAQIKKLLMTALKWPLEDPFSPRHADAFNYTYLVTNPTNLCNFFSFHFQQRSIGILVKIHCRIIFKGFFLFLERLLVMSSMADGHWKPLCAKHLWKPLMSMRNGDRGYLCYHTIPVKLSREEKVFFYDSSPYTQPYFSCLQLAVSRTSDTLTEKIMLLYTLHLSCHLPRNSCAGQIQCPYAVHNLVWTIIIHPIFRLPDPPFPPCNQ